jgi:hypothetical protein
MEKIKSLFVILLCSFTFAGHEVNNGGHGLECEDGSFIFFDYYFIERIWDQPIDIPKEDSPFKAAIQVTTRLAEYFPTEATSLIFNIMNLRNNIEFSTDLIINDTNDIATPIQPRDCQLRQIAVQFQDPFTNDVRVIVDDIFYQRLSFRDKVGLILHEAIYSTYHFRNAKKVRQLNYLLSANLVSYEKIKNIVPIAVNLGFKIIKYADIWIKIDEALVFNGVNSVKMAKIHPHTPLVKIGEDFVKPVGNSSINFYNVGKISSMEVEVLNQLRFYVKKKRIVLPAGKYRLDFDVNKNVIAYEALGQRYND